MSQPASSLKNAAKIAIYAVFVLLVGSVFFYKERLLFLDSACAVFQRINFNLEKTDQRYGVFITQLIIFFGAKLHLSLKAILILYSASFNIFYLIVLFFLVYKFEEYSMAILMAMYYFLFVSDSWYWPHNEVHQGVAWMFLFFAITFAMAKKQSRWFIHIPVFIVLSLLSVITHPLVMISTIALWLFFWIDRSSWHYSKKETVLYSCLLVGVIAFKYYLSNKMGYDSWKMRNAKHMSFVDMVDAFKCLFADTFWHDCLINYWWSLIIFMMGIVMCIKEKRYFILLWTIMFSVGFFIIVCRTFGPNAYDYHGRFYLESELGILSLFIAAPFVFYFLPKLTNIKASVLLTAIFITRIVYIMMAFPLFHKRIEFIEAGLQEMREKGLTKVILKKDKQIEDKALMDWGLPYESILASKLNGDKPQLTFLALSDNEIERNARPDNKTMINDWGFEDLSNKFYFQIDTSRPYEALTYDQLFTK
jgi:hypothetical protein